MVGVRLFSPFRVYLLFVGCWDLAEGGKKLQASLGYYRSRPLLFDAAACLIRQVTTLATYGVDTLRAEPMEL